MSPELQEITFALLRLSLDAESLDSFLNRVKDRPLSKEDWAAIYDFCKKQTIIGVVLVGVNKLPEALRPPRVILDKWICQGFYIQRDNIRFNAMCAKITKMFMDRGLHPVILKGQANAHLYPDPLSRQCGDIDVLVEGGKKNVIKHLTEMGLMEGADANSLHHVHLNAKLFDGISVEVHFKPVECAPFGAGRRLLKFLEETADFAKCRYNPLGFYEPPLEFALAMQLGHVRRHFIGGGVGLRQFVDYHQVLKFCSAESFQLFCEKVKKIGLESMLKSMMWVQEELFFLKKESLPCEKDPLWGGKLLNLAIGGGNFGHSADHGEESSLKRWSRERKSSLRYKNFDFFEYVWFEMCYWYVFARFMPQRIKQRKLSLRK